MVKIRRAYEALFLGLFLFFLFITDLRYLKGWPVSLFLEATPLVAVSTALTTHTLYRNLVWGLVVIAITMMLGRVWCNWMCPFGILHHLFGWIGNRRNTKQMIEVNRYRKIYAIKYYILAAMIVMAAAWIIPTLLGVARHGGTDLRGVRTRRGTAARRCRSAPPSRCSGRRSSRHSSPAQARLHAARRGSAGYRRRRTQARTPGCRRRLALPSGSLSGRARPTLDAVVARGFSVAAEEHKTETSTLQIGLLDPIALTVRSMTTSVLPTVHTATREDLHRASRVHVGLDRRRDLRRPAGGELVDPPLLLPRALPAGRAARAVQPVRALADRPRPGALHRLRPLPQELRGRERPARRPPQERVLRLPELHRGLPARRPGVPVPAPQGERGRLPVVGRRQLLMSGLFGLLFFPMVRQSGMVRKNWSQYVIRPPGSVAEDEFLRRCIKCDQCIRVCPTNVLQPAMFEAGLEGLWTPIMVSKMGWCELNCTLCSQVCPTGAIREISIAEKLGAGPFEAQGPIKTGTAFYNQGRCLPWAMDTSCVVCEEVCPVSPKAIFTRNVEVTSRWGETLELKRPFIDAREVHRLRHLRARMPREGRPGRLCDGRRRDPQQGALAPAVAGRRPRDAGSLLRRLIARAARRLRSLGREVLVGPIARPTA